MMTGEDGSATGLAARELLIDRQSPRFEARTFSALPVDAGTERTYQASARQFRRYWTVIAPFAGYIMRHWLTLAKQHAEQGQQAPNAPECPRAASWGIPR